MTQSRLELLKSQALFAPLPDQTLERIAEAAGVQRFTANGFLFREGETPEFIYCVLQGGLILVAGNGTGEAVLEFVGAGETVLLPDAVLGSPYSVSARASSDGQALMIPTARFRQLMDSDVTLAAQCARVLARQWRGLISQVREIKAHGAAERLAQFLIGRADRSTGAASLVLPGMKKEVATRLGIKPETLSRTLRKLRDYGVNTHGDMIRISSLERLATLVTKPQEFDREAR
jgi:CRP/FNR family transcriptional activator FtrB